MSRGGRRDAHGHVAGTARALSATTLALGMLATGCSRPASSPGPAQASSPAPRSAAVSTPAPTSTSAPGPASTSAASLTPSPVAPRTSTPTPGATTPSSSAGRPLAGMVIGVDAGHDGGNSTHTAQITRAVDAGFGSTKECDTTGTETNPAADGSTYSEHAHNFDVANRLAAELRRLGASVVLSRTTDTGVGPCVDQRNAVFRRAHAQVVVSIHADGDMAASARGFHVIHGTRAEGGARVVAASTTLATDVRDAFAAATGMPRSTYVGGGTALSPRSDIAACNLALVPTVMLEAGNMRNRLDAALLTSAAFRQQEADGLARALVAFASHSQH